MSRLIPNENTWFGFTPTVVNLDSPKLAEIAAAVNLTPWLLSVNASTTGNTVPTPSLDTLFETSIPGTVQAAFTADFYRDDDTDTAWETLPRKTEGFVVLSRFGGSGVNNKPTTGDDVEIWPIMVVSRTNSNNTNNAVMTFTMTASVPVEPVEAAIIVAS